MKLAIFGASGATGRHLLRLALEAGHTVTVLLRSADSLPFEHPRLTHVLGHFDHAVALQSVTSDADAVISVLGARKGAARPSAATPCAPLCRPCRPPARAG